MNERIHRVFDGELPEEALEPHERLELLVIKEAIGSGLRAVPLETAPDLAPAIMTRLGELAGPVQEVAPPLERSRGAREPLAGWSGVVDWLWRPRAVALTWRPVHALAATLVLCIGGPMVLRPGDVPGAGAGRGAASAAAPQVLVQFRLDAPDAREVALAGDFTDWRPAYLLRRSAAGIWTVVAPLEPGVHDYAFVVDGERWVPDPMAPAVADGFGGLNSRVAVMTADPRRPL